MNRYTKVRELVKDPSLTIKDIAQQTGYNKGHVSRLRKESMRQAEGKEHINREPMKHIKTWNERCEEHPDHQERIISERMIQARMQEEIDELRQALETEREWVGLTAPEVQECYDLNPARFASRIEAKLKERNT